jgi:hypothetical protein
MLSASFVQKLEVCGVAVRTVEALFLHNKVFYLIRFHQCVSIYGY